MSAVRPINPVIVVTGAANGIGAATAQRFAADGARVVALDRDEAGLRKLAADLDGRELTCLTTDVASEQSCADAAAAIKAAFGRVDVLVNAVGVYPAQPFERMSFAQ